MSDHYFSSRPSSEKKQYRIETTILEKNLVFHTDNGVFSKNEVDFGSRLLVESVEMNGAEEVLDLGCAYGVIGIALAKAYPKVRVTMVELNERAAQLAVNNAEKNKVKEQIQVYTGDGYAPIPNKKFDLILLNPPIRAGKKVVYSLFEGSKEHLMPKGEFWIVIRKQQGAPSACDMLHKIYSSVQIVTKEKGYWIVRASSAGYQISEK